jgi:hypothetical protein
MHWITSVEHVEGYKLGLTFEDGTTRLVDLAAHLEGEMFEPLRDVHLFQTARLNSDIDTVVWDNGADMSPDFLYDIGVPVKTKRRAVSHVAESKAKYARGEGK